MSQLIKNLFTVEEVIQSAEKVLNQALQERDQIHFEIYKESQSPETFASWKRLNADFLNATENDEREEHFFINTYVGDEAFLKDNEIESYFTRLKNEKT